MADIGWLVLAAWVLFALAAWVLARGDERRLRRVELTLEQWYAQRTPEQQRAWLRHPRHRQRCSCRRYGLPFPGMERVIDNTVDHTADACWPSQESLDR